MQESTKSKIKLISESYQLEKEKQDESGKKKMVKENEFLKEFGIILDKTIKPTLIDISNELKEAGHETNITSSGNNEDSISISLYLVPKETEPNNSTNGGKPYIKFATDKKNEKVIIFKNNMLRYAGGSSGAMGQYVLQDINSAFVEQNVLIFIDEVFENAKRALKIPKLND